MNIFKLVTKFTLGGQMSEQGADKAGMKLYQGFKFFLIACGIAVLFWQSPNLINAIAQFIITLKNS